MKQKSAVILLHLSYWIFNLFRNTFLYQHTVYSLIIDQSVIAGVSYLNYFILFPYALKKNKWYYYLLWIFVFFSVFTTAYSLWNCTHFWLPFLSARTFKWNNVIGAFNVAFLYGGLSSGARLLYNWVNNQKKNRALELQKKKNALKYMKSNMNIPLLLDTLNYAEKISASTPLKAETPILLLSEVLRYGLYESDKPQTNLQQELVVVASYIQLQNQVDNHVKLILQNELTYHNSVLPPGIILHFITTWKSILANYLTDTQKIAVNSAEKSIIVSLSCKNIPVLILEDFLKQMESFSDDLFQITYTYDNQFIYLKILNLTL